MRWIFSPQGFGHILREMYAMDRKPCDKDEGGCGASLPTDHSLVRAPAVFTRSVAFYWRNRPKPQ